MRSNDDGEDVGAEAGERVHPALKRTGTVAPPVVQPSVTEFEVSLDGSGVGAGAAAAASSCCAAVPLFGVKSSVQGKPTSSPLSLLLRQRAARTWWRGLSCGVCFAAGAWAREGHAVFGAVLAVMVVCAETVLHELNALPPVVASSTVLKRCNPTSHRHR